jgi:tRNA U34 5-carboxymethylaminomethyl modifying GTPase MnmE/TrmE
VEEAGILRTRGKIEEAQMVLFMIDTSRPLEEEDRLIFEEIGEKPTIVLLNKVDLPSVVAVEEVREKFSGEIVLPISARYGQGIERLKEKLYELFMANSFPEVLPDLIPTLNSQKVVSSFAQAGTQTTHSFQISYDFIHFNIWTSVLSLP